MTNEPKLPKEWEELIDASLTHDGLDYRSTYQFLATIHAQHSAEVVRLSRENSHMRTLLAHVPDEKCIYCGLDNMAKCPRGFPGCSKADDLIAGEDVEFLRLLGEHRSLTAEVEGLRARITKMEGLLRRYRNETPLGHQPHMIAHVVDQVLGGSK